MAIYEPMFFANEPIWVVQIKKDSAFAASLHDPTNSYFVIDDNNRCLVTITDNNIVSLFNGFGNRKISLIQESEIDHTLSPAEADKLFLTLNLNYFRVIHRLHTQMVFTDEKPKLYNLYVNCLKVIAKLMPKVTYDNPDSSGVYNAFAKSFLYDLEYVVENQECTKIELE